MRHIGKALALLAMLFTTGCACRQIPDFNEEEWAERTKSYDLSLLYADHQDENGIFFNPWLQSDTPGPITLFTTKKLKFPDYPAQLYTSRDNSYSYISDPTNSSISFVGHATFIIKMNGQTIITDPFFSGSALIIKKEVNINFDYSKLPDKPVILISHNHYDHLDKVTVKQLIKYNAVFLVPLKLKEFFTDLGAKEVYELDWWQDITINDVKYTFVPAQHWSNRIGQARNSTLWGGFIIEGEQTVYFSGDSGYFRGYEEFGRKYAIDYAIMGVGANEPRWFMHYSHQNVAEFFNAVDDLNAKKAIPMHFGIIQLGQEPVLYPLYQIYNYLGEHPEYKERVTPLRVGEYIQTGDIQQ